MMALDSPRPASPGGAGPEQARLALPQRESPAAPPLIGAAAVTAAAKGQALGPQQDYAKPNPGTRVGFAAGPGPSPTAAMRDGRPADAPAGLDASDGAEGPDLSELPGLPAPLKGLGIPPLNTRKVGDFDKLDDLPPPVGLDIAEQLAVLDPPEAGSIDLRR